ncbi:MULTISPECIES: hypothetical protein [unclassified Microcoleus]
MTLAIVAEPVPLQANSERVFYCSCGTIISYAVSLSVVVQSKAHL